MFEAVDNMTVNSISNFWAKIPDEYLDQVKNAFVNGSFFEMEGGWKMMQSEIGKEATDLLYFFVQNY
jgi:hypothetical protein